MSAPAPVATAAAALTDGTAVSPASVKKVVKDFVADFLIGASAGVVTSGIAGLEQAVAAPLIVAFALGNAAIAAGYRTVLRWATS